MFWRYLLVVWKDASSTPNTVNHVVKQEAIGEAQEHKGKGHRVMIVDLVLGVCITEKMI